MTYSTKDKGLRGQSNVGTAKPSSRKIITKLHRIIDLLKNRPEGLNRFEAEQFGDHCLNSTVAVIRDMYGDKLIQRWEKVPSRYTNRGARVCRYWLAGEGMVSADE